MRRETKDIINFDSTFKAVIFNTLYHSIGLIKNHLTLSKNVCFGVFSTAQKCY
jgi:hypothetical protein